MKVPIPKILFFEQPSQRRLPPGIFGGARWEVYCRSIHPLLDKLLERHRAVHQLYTPVIYIKVKKVQIVVVVVVLS